MPRLIAVLLYGSGLRLTECLELRVKDVDFAQRQMAVRQGKGGGDRLVPLPGTAIDDLRRHLDDVRRLHERDLTAGFGRVVLPEAIGVKYPTADTEWRWQFVFPAARICRDPRWGHPSRFHLHESVVQRAVTDAVRRAGLSKRASCHSFRHYSASRTMPSDVGHPLRSGQQLLLENDVRLATRSA